jgi:hypothetical protein
VFSIFICTAIFNVFYTKKPVSVETTQSNEVGSVYASLKP